MAKEIVDEPAETISLKQALPPTINAWDARKQTMAPAAIDDARTTGEGCPPVIQFGTVTSDFDTNENAIPASAANGNDGVKIAKKMRSANAPSPAAMSDAKAWPDVAQAADKVAEVKKDKVKEKKESEDSSVVDDGSVSGSKRCSSLSRCGLTDS